jgi:diguanylate cyclase (GGDEF)-like protein/PAS domain S-box-containing protein
VAEMHGVLTPPCWVHHGNLRLLCPRLSRAGPRLMGARPAVLQSKLHHRLLAGGSAQAAERRAKLGIQCQALQAERDAWQALAQARAAALQQSEARLANLLSLSADWIWEQDANLAFTYLSDGFEAVAGIAPALLIGRQRDASLAFDAAPAAVQVYEACLIQRVAFHDFNYVFTRPDGVKRHIRISGEPVFDEAGEFQGYRGVGRDVTLTAQAEAKVREMARYDSLTGLPNRNLFLSELDRAIARSKRHGNEFGLCFIDLDRFKTVNDTLGHEAGDELLKTTAARLRSAVRENDLVARLGGDEFVVLLESSVSVGDLNAVAQKLLTALGEPVDISGNTFLVTGSIGIALYPGDGEDCVTLLRRADAAMYLAKEKGKNNVQFYTAELADLAAQQFEMESALRLALTRDEFVLHFQPKIDIPSGALLGVEALLRWLHPQRGMVAPMDFIPLAEERGLIVPIGRWVMRAACRQIRDWRAAGLNAPAVAVNLSARQFASDSLLTDLTDALSEFGVPASDLEVELTESVLMTDPQRAKRVLNSLHALGIRISIDDFGTGYSSLSYLKRFPAQTVKIDRSFISGLPTDKDDAAITEAVISMAHSLGLNVVAEGVETQDQLATLRRLGCDEAQGFLMARPMNAAALAQWMDARRLGAEGMAPHNADFVI